MKARVLAKVGGQGKMYEKGGHEGTAIYFEDAFKHDHLRTAHVKSESPFELMQIIVGIINTNAFHCKSFDCARIYSSGTFWG